MDLRHDVVSLDAIVANLDEGEGRNDALRAYVYALRDLQVAYTATSYADGGTAEEKDAAIRQAQDDVATAFDALIAAEFALNQSSLWTHDRENKQ